jgi:hypothetical protein
MSQVMTLSPATITACPAWCGIDHADDDSEFHIADEAYFEMELSLAERGYVPGDGPISDYLTIHLLQPGDSATPVISGVASTLSDLELPNMTLAEAEALGVALLELVRQARRSA